MCQANQEGFGMNNTLISLFPYTGQVPEALKVAIYIFWFDFLIYHAGKY